MRPGDLCKWETSELISFIEHTVKFLGVFMPYFLISDFANVSHIKFSLCKWCISMANMHYKIADESWYFTLDAMKTEGLLRKLL